MTPIKSTKLFQPLQVGKFQVQHRIVHLPTTRLRASSEHVPTDLQLQYYSDRTKIPGTLVITEGTIISPQQGGIPNVPGIWNDTQAKAWKKITDAVHENNSAIAIQFGTLGRVAKPEFLKVQGLPLIAPSAVYESDESKLAAEAQGNTIHELTEHEIHDMIHNQYVNAAEKALAAGFDFIEIHAAYGYLLDQFINPSSNKRTDNYGGSIENRAKILFEVVDTLIPIVGADKLAVRLSPFNNFQGMLAENEEVHPIATYGYIVSELERRAKEGNRLAYINIVDGRFTATGDEVGVDNSFVKQIWQGILLRGGDHRGDKEQGWKEVRENVEDDRSLIGFGRFFIANPDLPDRIKNDHDLNPYDKDYFYGGNNFGYNTYPFANQHSKFDKEIEFKKVGKPLA